MSNEEYELIKQCVRNWRRRYDGASDEEYYGVAWEHLEKARRLFDGRGNWIRFARQRVTYGLMSEYRSIHRKIKDLTFVSYNAELHEKPNILASAVDLIDEIENRMQLEIFERFAEWKRKGRK